MAEWIYFIHPPRENFAETITADEQAVWGDHWQHLQRLNAERSLILAGPTMGSKNTGICIFEASDEAAARAVMESDPIFASGFAELELRPFVVSLIRQS